MIHECITVLNVVHCKALVWDTWPDTVCFNARSQL